MIHKYGNTGGLITGRGKPMGSGENTSPVPFPPLIPHGLAWNSTLALTRGEKRETNGRRYGKQNELVKWTVNISAFQSCSIFSFLSKNLKCKFVSHFSETIHCTKLCPGYSYIIKFSNCWYDVSVTVNMHWNVSKVSFCEMNCRHCWLVMSTADL